MSTKHTLYLMLGAAAVIFLRRPSLFIDGQVYAEEGTTYFQFAWYAPWWKALLVPHLGYFALWPNLCALIAARVLPLADVANFFPAAAAVVQLLTVYLAIECEALAEHRALAGLICLIAVPSEEVWGTTITSMFYLALCTGLILISRPEKLQVLRFGTLLLGGLTGPASCCFAPFFIIRAILQKSRMTIRHAVLITGCAVLQGSLVLSALRHSARGLPISQKMEALGSEIFLKSLITGFGSRLALHGALHFVRPGMEAYAVLWVLCIPFLLFLYWVACTGGVTARRLIALALWSITFNMLGALGSATNLMRGDDRYFFAANAFIFLAILLCASRTKHILAKTAMVLVMLSCTTDYFIYTIRHPTQPDWRVQVAQWQADPSTPLKVAPATWGSVLRLTRTHPDENLRADTFDAWR